MAKPPRTNIQGTFFVTTVTYNRRRFFQVDTNARLLIDTICHYRDEGLYKLYGFVIMPDHMHLIIKTDSLPRAMHGIKGGFSHRVDSSFPVWQKGYTDHLVTNREQFDSRLAYIHQNPVRARLIQDASDFPYSSAFRGGVRKKEEDHSSVWPG